MKTFDEAIKTVCIGDIQNLEHCEKVKDHQIKSISMIEEVCKSSEANFVAIALLRNLPEISTRSLLTCIKNAMAQGVLIGMEMERSQNDISIE